MWKTLQVYAQLNRLNNHLKISYLFELVHQRLANPPQQPFSYLKQRDTMIKKIRKSATFEEGLALWKKDSGYHQRSRIEAFMNRLKRIFGFYWHSRTTSGRINEMIIKMNLLNQMSAMGNAQYYP